jgi:hypothetical protein
MINILDVIYLIYFVYRNIVYNLNYTSITLALQSWRKIISGDTRTKRLNTTALMHQKCYIMS